MHSFNRALLIYILISDSTNSSVTVKELFTQQVNRSGPYAFVDMGRGKLTLGENYFL